MSVVEPGSAGAGLIGRVKDILTKPGPTWDVIDGEQPTVQSLYTGYVMPLAAIPAVAQAIGMTVFGAGAFGVVVKWSPVTAIVQAIVGYALSLVLVFVLALIIEALAPNFGGTKDRIQALKVAAYGYTASWVAGIFAIFPPIAMLALLGGLYSLYLLYLGLPKLMKTPEDKALPYTAVVVVVAIVVSFIITMVMGSVAVMTGAGAGMMSGAQVSGTVKLPGGEGSVDVGKLAAAAKAIESGESGPATDPEALKAYLPASVAGFTRGEVSTSSGGAAGIEGSEAEAEYAKGEANLRLQVTDLGQAGALAGMAGAFKVKSSKETATGYEKMGVVNGRMTQESYDRSDKSGEYSVLVGERFMVHARGSGVSMDELKAAVEAVGLSRLEAAAKAG
ncbi:Yip1 family protein [Phenylobacterium sp.]|uniref:Yip1 family protein n=1 Tax=Phenylobacterium sp. TaxID=1871053 RepID=UPI002EDAEE53